MALFLLSPHTTPRFANRAFLLTEGSFEGPPFRTHSGLTLELFHIFKAEAHLRTLANPQCQIHPGQQTQDTPPVDSAGSCFPSFG
jgi:hypothetical protein